MSYIIYWLFTFHITYFVANMVEFRIHNFKICVCVKLINENYPEFRKEPFNSNYPICDTKLNFRLIPNLFSSLPAHNFALSYIVYSSLNLFLHLIINYTDIKNVHEFKVLYVIKVWVLHEYKYRIVLYHCMVVLYEFKMTCFLFFINKLIFIHTNSMYIYFIVCLI